MVYQIHNLIKSIFLKFSFHQTSIAVFSYRRSYISSAYNIVGSSIFIAFDFIMSASGFEVCSRLCRALDPLFRSLKLMTNSFVEKLLVGKIVSCRFMLHNRFRISRHPSSAPNIIVSFTWKCLKFLLELRKDL